jgi:hypothetical protein
LPALATLLGPTFFVLGVWVSPVDQMDNWKARGVNTVVESPQGHDPLQWAKAAGSKGLYEIRAASSDLSFDLSDSHLLAWATKDEPSDNKLRLDYGWVQQDPAQVLQQAAPWRAAAKARGRFVPIWTNHVGPHISPDWAQKNALMRDYMEGPESDWLAADSYPNQGHKPFVIQSNDGYTSTVQGVVLDRQIAWSHGKPVMTFIGTSDFNNNGGLPTAAQFNVMAWSSVIHGAVGVIYFPVHFDPWSFDATPPDLVRALSAFDREVAGLQKVLMNDTAGGRRPSTLFRSANSGAAAGRGQLPYPFEASEIPTSQGPYRIILNLSDKAQVLNKPEWGLSNAAFQGYEIRKGYAPGPRPAARAGGGNTQ